MQSIASGTTEHSKIEQICLDCFEPIYLLDILIESDPRMLKQPESY